MILTKSIKEYCQERKNQIKEYIASRSDWEICPPKLAVIQVGNVEASNRYIKNKKKDCEEVGIKFEWYHFDETITQEELIFEIQNLNPFVDGLIVQLPLPDHINLDGIKNAIDPHKDVDGFGLLSLFDPCTPLGIYLYLMNGCGYNFCGKHVVIIGRSDIVGKPMAQILTDADATVTLCHSKTADLQRHIKAADLIICAVGKANFLDCSNIYVPVIDVGINFDENGKLVGDCYNTMGKDVTPVPGGVGLLTRVELLANTIAAAQYRPNGKAGNGND